jgi:hypothetical protein
VRDRCAARFFFAPHILIFVIFANAFVHSRISIPKSYNRFPMARQIGPVQARIEYTGITAITAALRAMRAGARLVCYATLIQFVVGKTVEADSGSPVVPIAQIRLDAMSFGIGAGPIAPTEAIAQASPTSSPPKNASQIWPTVSQAQSEAEYPEEWKAQRRAEAAIAANQWVLKVPHVKGMMPWWIIDKNVPREEAIKKGIGETGVRVFVDEPENVREVEGKVPSQLDGVPVLVEANPTDAVF